MKVAYSHTATVLRFVLVMLLALVAGVKTLQIQGSYSMPLMARRLDVTPRDVITRSSAIHCAATCRLTSWCVSANLFTGDGKCELLTEEVLDDDDSLQSDEGWRYLRT